MSGIQDILSLLAETLPFEVLVVLGLAIAVFAVPAWLRSARTRQVRGAIRRIVRASDPATVASLEQRAFDLAARDGERIRVLAMEARKRGLPALEQRALSLLEGIQGYAHDARILREQTQRARPTARHPVEIAVTVERLIEQGLLQGAREQLDQALEEHPQDADLRGLKATLDQRIAESADGFSLDDDEAGR